MYLLSLDCTPFFVSSIALPLTALPRLPHFASLVPRQTSAQPVTCAHMQTRVRHRGMHPAGCPNHRARQGPAQASKPRGLRHAAAARACRPPPAGHALPDPQGAFLWMSPAPYSRYSALLIHICWKVPREARMEPPIHTLYRRSTALAGHTTCAPRWVAGRRRAVRGGSQEAGSVSHTRRSALCSGSKLHCSGAGGLLHFSGNPTPTPLRAAP